MSDVRHPLDNLQKQLDANPLRAVKALDSFVVSAGRVARVNEVLLVPEDLSEADATRLRLMSRVVIVSRPEAPPAGPEKPVVVPGVVGVRDPNPANRDPAPGGPTSVSPATGRRRSAK